MDNNIVRQINSLFQGWDTTTSPGCSLAVIRNGKIIFKNSYGMANLEHQITNKPSSVFYIASVSKHFAAFCILLLMEQGKLSIEDDVRLYIPELPEYDQIIKIRHMIHHTSGLRDFLELNYLSGRDFDELITDEDAMNLITRQKVLNFTPGERYLYCNSGYFLLSQIVKRVSGKSMRQFADENIFMPLGMLNTHFHDSHREPVPYRATGYSPLPGDSLPGYYINVPGLETVGSGGIYSSVEDLYLWDQNFYHNILGKGSRKLIDQMLTTGRFNDGSPQDYAFGLNVSEQNGLKKVRHSGGNGGYSAEFLQFPEKEFSVICLSNCGNLRAPELAAKVAEIFLPELITVDDPAASKSEKAEYFLPVDEQIKYCGLFYSSISELVIRIFSESSELQVEYMGQKSPLKPSSRNTFLSSFNSIKMKIVFSDKEQTFEEIYLTLGQKESDTLKRITQIEISPASLNLLPGEYFSQELRANALISLDKENNLILKLGRHKFVLEPGEKDMFLVPEGTLFVKWDENTQTIKAFELNTGRVKNIRFEKL